MAISRFFESNFISSNCSVGIARQRHPSLRSFWWTLSLKLLNSMSTVCAIGDIHGRSDLLKTLLDFLDEHSSRSKQSPRVYFLGDIVDRGPDSYGAMDLVCETLERWPDSRLLLGNHDFLFRDALTKQNLVEAWYARGAATTLASYLGPSDFYSLDELVGISDRFPEHLRVLEAASTIEVMGRYAFVHAGIDPSVELSGQDLNVLLQTRTKFLDHVGALSHVVVHGHTPLTPPRPVVTENRISLDTNAVYSGVLTMAMIDTENDSIEFYSTDPGGDVKPIAPTLLDRGLGTIWRAPRLHTV
uniref:Metallophosphoesterase n=1 Tax=Rhodopseudomonas palustris (strain BisA53) TaxID=316055 RepID=Q07NT2_RHOP5